MLFYWQNHAREDRVMSEKCSRCKKNDQLGTAQRIEFQHAGLVFRCFASSFYCKECEKKEEIERFDRYLGKLMTVESSKLKINWNYFEHGPRGTGWRQRDNPDDMALLLEVIGVFSRYAIGNWGLQSGGLSLNLNFGGLFPFYFTNEEYAKEYAEVAYGNARFHVSICKYER